MTHKVNAIVNKKLTDIGIEPDKSISIGATNIADEEISIIFKMIGPEKSLHDFIERFNNHDLGQYWDLLLGLSTKAEHEELFGIFEEQKKYLTEEYIGSYDELQIKIKEYSAKHYGFKNMKHTYKSYGPINNQGYLQLEMSCDSLAIPLFREIAVMYDESVFVIQYISKQFTGYYIINVSAGLERLSGNSEVGIENNRSAIHEVYRGDDFYTSAKAEGSEWLNNFPF